MKWNMLDRDKFWWNFLHFKLDEAKTENFVAIIDELDTIEDLGYEDFKKRNFAEIQK